MVFNVFVIVFIWRCFNILRFCFVFILILSFSCMLMVDESFIGGGLIFVFYEDGIIGFLCIGVGCGILLLLLMLFNFFI